MTIERHNIKASPLFNLTPMGINTALVESLDSFAYRLSKEHCVPRYLIDALVENDGRPLLKHKRAKNMISLIGLTPGVKNYAAQLAKLTSQPDVARLGLGNVSGVLSNNGACKKNRAWCPECFAEQKLSGQSPYTPQLWAIGDYKECHIHHCELVERCPSCWLTLPFKKDGHIRIDHCNFCKKNFK